MVIHKNKKQKTFTLHVLHVFFFGRICFGRGILVDSVLVNTLDFSSQTKESIEALLNVVQVGKYEWNSLVLSLNTSQFHYNCWTMHNANTHTYTKTHTQVNETKQKPLRSQKIHIMCMTVN